MMLSSVQPLNPTSVLIWEDVTEIYVAAEIIEIIGQNLIDALNVSVSLDAQDPPFSEASGFPAPVLETTAQSKNVKLMFDAAVSIQSVVTEHDVNRYIMGAFNSDAEQMLYLAMLKATGDVAFLNASNVTVTPASYISPVQNPDNDGRMDSPNSDGLVVTSSNDGDTSGLSTEFIVGVTLICFGAIALAASFLYTRSHSASLGDTRNMSVWEMETGLKAEAISPRNPHPTSIIKGESLYRAKKETGTWAEAISPRNPYPTSYVEDESMYRMEMETGTWAKAISPKYRYPTSVVEDETLFSYNVGNLGGVTAAQSTCDEFEDEFSFASISSLTKTEFGTCESYLTTENKMLTKFQVAAPPGDLGLVLGTSEEGMTIVEEITRFSPLTGQVRVGDRLLALDGRDITMMIAATVSRLIISKEYNRVRQFMLARPEE